MILIRICSLEFRVNSSNSEICSRIYEVLADADQCLPRRLARLAAAHKDALNAASRQEPTQLFRRNEICSAILFLEGKVTFSVYDCTVACQVDYVGPELAHLFLQLLKGALVTGIEGHILTVDGPKEGLLFFFVVQSRQIRGRAGHEEQAQWSGSKLSGEEGHLLGCAGKAADSEERIDTE